MKPAVSRPIRENASRSLISRCIRWAPSTANPMYWSARSSSWPRVPALQQLAEAGHLAQRLLQVVRGDVGELLEVAVGPGQLLGLGLELVVHPLDLGARLAHLGQLGGDLLAHAVDVRGQADQLRRAAAGDVPVVVAAGDLADLLGQLHHRPADQAVEQQHQGRPGQDDDRGRGDLDRDHGLAGRPWRRRRTASRSTRMCRCMIVDRRRAARRTGSCVAASTSAWPASGPSGPDGVDHRLGDRRRASRRPAVSHPPQRVADARRSPRPQQAVDPRDQALLLGHARRCTGARFVRPGR